MNTILHDIYGQNIGAQTQRYQQALHSFYHTYGPGEVSIFRSPGRVNLIGEHTDYNHGFVMPVALDKDILLLARPRPDSTVRLANVEAEFAPLSFDIQPGIPPGPAGEWGNYAKGAVRQLAHQLGPGLRGLDGLVVGQAPHGVPRGVGLGSSSAMTIVVAVALASLNKWQPDGVTMARLCAEAEWYVGTRGGIMDHFIALLGQRDHALFLDCRPRANGQYTTQHIPLPQGYSILIASSGVRHQNARGAFNHRVAACRAGVQLLQSHYPGVTHLRDVQLVPWDDLAPFLPERATVAELTQRGIRLHDLPGLTPDAILKIRPRCQHVWTENWRVQQAVDAMHAGEIQTLGQLLNQAHASARDLYEISCPEIAILVKAAREVDGVVGARLSGAGWGGCIMAIVRDDAVQALQEHVGRQYQAQTGRPTAIFTCRTAPGAGQCFLEQ